MDKREYHAAMMRHLRKLPQYKEYNRRYQRKHRDSHNRVMRASYQRTKHLVSFKRRFRCGLTVGQIEARLRADGNDAIDFITKHCHKSDPDVSLLYVQA